MRINFLCVNLGWRRSPSVAKEDPDNWKWARPDSGTAHASQRQVGGEGEGPPECKLLEYFEFCAKNRQNNCYVLLFKFRATFVPYNLARFTGILKSRTKRDGLTWYMLYKFPEGQKNTI